MTERAIKELPPLSEELIKNLETRFPDRCPDILTTERQLWMDAGAAFVVRLLKREFERQQRNGIMGAE